MNYIASTWVKTQMMDSDRLLYPNLDDIIRAVAPNGRAADPDEVRRWLLTSRLPLISQTLTRVGRCWNHLLL